MLGYVQSKNNEDTAMSAARQLTMQPDPGPDVGPSYQEIMAADPNLPPLDYLQQSPVALGTADVSKDRYIDPAFHKREVEKIWRKAWQFTCREEEIPDVGDVVVYDINDDSFIITRSGPDTISAYVNACLHRGTKLCGADTHVKQFRCPFHGFTWALDGTLQEVPSRWDFPQIQDENFKLPEARVGRWAGFVFITMDPEAPALADYLGILPKHFKGFSDYNKKYRFAHYQKILPCNWKVMIEAFLESYHSTETHPQTLPFTPETRVQYDVYGPHVSRFLGGIGVQSTQIKDKLSEQDIYNYMFKFMAGPDAAAPDLQAGETARAALANAARAMTGQMNNVDYTGCSDAEALDGAQYFLFPNLVLFRGFSFPLVYRMRPYKNDPDKCIFDFIIMRDLADGVEMPPPAEIVKMGDMTFTEIAELPKWLGQIYDQDCNNVELQQLGLKATARAGVVVSDYQEVRVRHMQQTVDEYLNRP
jgi:phenylpropionate dioxygenase-like ring-hydroxylating dioxygenase large terminal subunit